MQILKITIDQIQAGRTVLQLLRSYNPKIKDARLYKACRKGEVRVNKSRVKFSERLKCNDLVRLPVFQAEIEQYQAVPEWLLACIIYEDEHVIAINKPGGLSVHAGNQVDFGLIEILRQDQRWPETLDLVHRLDRATSGVVIISKNVLIKRELSLQFAQRLVQKEYWALLEGHVPLTMKTLTHKLFTTNDFKVICAESGKVAQTTISSIEHCLMADKPVTKVVLLPSTGRKHQLRVQCQAIGHPIVGDNLYGNGGKMLFLHAAQICYTDPLTKVLITIKAPLPEEKAQCWNSLITIS